MTSARAIAQQFLHLGWGTQPNWREIWDELMSETVIYHFNSEAEPIIGLEANKEFNQSLFDGFPDIQQTLGDMIVEGDDQGTMQGNRVVYRTTITGTHTGDFLGTPPTGKSIKVNDFTLLRIEHGKIQEWWYECNLLAVMQQLGLIPV